MAQGGKESSEELEEKEGLILWQKPFEIMCLCLVSKIYIDWKASVVNLIAQSTL